METELHSLAYFSRNTIEECGGDLSAEIVRILAAARENNRQMGVTGALLFSGGCFAQVLEGSLEAVESIFERIQCDPRHRDVSVLHFKPVGARSFASWSMAYSGPSAPASLNGGLDRSSCEAGQDLVTVLTELIARYEAP